MIRIKKITILGVGLMGGSLALALRRVFPRAAICGYARSQKSYHKLSKLKILDSVELELKEAIRDSDIIILASPVYSVINYFKKISPFLKAGAIIFDIASTKETIEKAAAKNLTKDVYFVGCHPLAGSEKSGAQFSQSNLYKGATCIITSPAKNLATKVVKDIWEKMGAKVLFMPAKFHDKILSSVSHLSHIISFSLASSISDSYLRFCPQSLKDMARISNSPSLVWADIFLSNKKNILGDIEIFKGILNKFEQALRKGEKDKIIKLIKNANKKGKKIS